MKDKDGWVDELKAGDVVLVWEYRLCGGRHFKYVVQRVTATQVLIGKSLEDSRPQRYSKRTLNVVGQSGGYHNSYLVQANDERLAEVARLNLFDLAEALKQRSLRKDLTVAEYRALIDVLKRTTKQPERR